MVQDVIALQVFYDRHLEQIEKTIQNVVSRDCPSPLIYEIFSYHFKKTGRRLRSYLSTNLSLNLQSTDMEHSYSFSAVMELIHNASIIHDDLEDGDFYRRGTINVWKKYSPSQAINLGDLLFTKALELILHSSIPGEMQLLLTRRILMAINELICGQMLEVSLRNTTAMSWQDWETIAAQKTGALFRLIFEGAFLLSGVDISLIRSELESLGKILGYIYQMRDDLLDVKGLKEGRSPGSDILEGKMTCFSILAFNRGGKIQKAVIDAITNTQAPEESRIQPLQRYFEDQSIYTSIKELYRNQIERCKKHPLFLKFPSINASVCAFLDQLELPQ